MAEVRTADPVAQRRVVLVVIVGAIAGALSITAFERYGTSVEEWLLSEPGQLVHRIKLVFFSLGAALSVPLIGVAGYFWSIGVRVLKAREFPPPGLRVLRDTPVSLAIDAIWRGRALQVVAFCLAVAAAVLWVVIVQLARVVSERVA